MNPLNLLINLVVAVILVVVAFWLLGLLVASVALPVIVITLLKLLIVLVACAWVLGFMGSNIIWR